MSTTEKRNSNLSKSVHSDRLEFTPHEVKCCVKVTTSLMLVAAELSQVALFVIATHDLGTEAAPVPV